MSERRSLGARAPSNRPVQVSASSQPPNKPLRTRDQVQTANLTDKAHPSWPNHQLQHLLSAPQPIRQNLQFQHMFLALPTRNCDGMAERSKAMRSGRRVLLASHGIIDIILQRVTNAMTQRLSSIPSTNIPQLLHPA